MKNIKSENYNRIVVFVVGAVIGFIVFAAIYGLDVVRFTNDSFLINGYIEKDLEQHYAGWLLYRTSPWQFPLGVGKNISYPYGSAVSYTDSIPIFAIFFKLLRGILPETFQYFGLYVLLCFVLQGGFGGLLASLFSESKVMCGLSSLMFVMSPVMIERAFRHCALASHYLILAALYFYFKNKGRYDIKSVMPFFVINCLAITIHPYFMPFTFAIMFAYCVEIFFLQKQFVKPVLYILSSIAITLFTGWVIGVFYTKGSMAASGYGLFSMNLNAFYNPVSVGLSNWSKIIGIRPFYIDYQIEGFNYLGLGVLLSVPVAFLLYIIHSGKDVVKNIVWFIKNHFGIIFSAIMLFIFAIGDTISFGALKIFRIPYPNVLVEKLFGIFRANGRFGWLVGYLIVLFIVYVLLTFTKSKKSLVTVALAALMCAVQIWDMGDVLSSKHAYFAGTEGDLQNQIKPKVISNSFWDVAAEKYEYAFLIDNGYPLIGIDIARTFGLAGKAVHTNFQARIDMEKTIEFVNQAYGWLENGTLSDDTIICFGDISPELAQQLKENNYDVFYCNHANIICRSVFTAQEIEAFTSEGDFMVLEYPYIVSAE